MDEIVYMLTVTSMTTVRNFDVARVKFNTFEISSTGN
jgi:hypothetical protein